MPKEALTNKMVLALRSDGTEQQIYDARQRGLVLRVSPKGDRLSWSVVYTNPAGKKQRQTLRGSDAASLDAARKAAARILGQAADGRDLSAERRHAKAALTLSDLLDGYIESRAPELRSGREVARRLNTFVRPALGDLKAAEIERANVADLMDRIKLGKVEDGKGGFYRASAATANRTFDDLKAVFGWGVDRGKIPASPMTRQKRPAETKARERVLSIAECRTILDRLPTVSMSAALKRILGLLLYTGARASEIAELRKSEIDLDAALIRLPASRVKNARAFVIPLSEPALDIVRAALPAAEQSDFLFPSPRDYGKPIDGHAVSTETRRAQPHFGLPHWTAHDFRRAVSTGLGEAGTPPHIVDRVLNHVSAGVTERHYNFAGYVNEHRAALEAWGKMITNRKNGA